MSVCLMISRDTSASFSRSGMGHDTVCNSFVFADSDDERLINYSAQYSVDETISMYVHQTRYHFIRKDNAAVNQNGKRK